MKLILASASPRRRDILDAAKISYVVRPSSADETYPDDMAAVDVPELLARRKAEAVAREAEADAVVIGADTVVLLDGKLLGKPRDEAEAKAMLRSLSGRAHHVVTGVCMVCQKFTDSFAICSMTEALKVMAITRLTMRCPNGAYMTSF